MGIDVCYPLFIHSTSLSHTTHTCSAQRAGALKLEPFVRALLAEEVAARRGTSGVTSEQLEADGYPDRVLGLDVIWGDASARASSI